MDPTWRRRLLTAVFLTGALGWGVAASAFHGKDVSARKLGGALDIADHRGVRHTLADFRGKTVLIFFGYTHCPDVCPTTLIRANRVMTLLGPDAARAQVLWMTVDPERDTPELLAQYVPAFNPGFLGLRGTDAETARITKAFRVSYQILHYKDRILVDHSAYGYLIDTHGRTRVRVDYDQSAESIAQDVRSLLAE
jgi:protein SCO1